MNRYNLGKSNLNVTRMGLGCMGMSEFYGKRNDEDSIRTLHAALELGMNFFDTADMYGSGRNERLLAKAFKDRWNELVLATKFSIMRGPNGEFLGVNASPEHAKKACEDSLKRLGRETIDLYYAHRPDPKVPVEETVGAMKELVEEGKVRYIGVSEYSAEQIRRAHKVHPITALQSEYSMWSRDPEGEIFDTCEELGIAFVSYSPLGRGFLTGAIPARDALDDDDRRLVMPRFQEKALAENMKFVEVIREIAKEKKITPAQLALAWVLNKNDFMFTIPGTTKIERLKENFAACDVKFSEDELKRINEKLPAETVGSRY